ncbi:RNA polymerase sigma factor [Engelhardtia mirabilis]|uniref:ECF RNA polymerase sigma factor SigD n=1 Tax=Engelhardtia mirabilis TaxID=2528011 RepID=A0A518BHL2_9BACT|nr:ECF RNA polymerase sigma factor SigD [Planctomycetes bacterium Pla133]QDV00782.1 ECF RNA polymerase sigma factor SigD [Planctomycetes bacterium Pla86]
MTSQDESPPEPDRTAALVERAGRGDREAIEALLLQHLARLRAFVRLKMGPVVRGRESSEDLVQSVCREVLEGLDGFEYRGEAGFRQWLFRRAEHKVIDRGRFWRRDKRDAAREVPATPLGDEGETLRGLESLFTPSRDVAAHEELGRLERAFAELPPDYQEVILLARVLELGHEEIAERMGRSVSSTWSLLSRALARLASKLED